MPLLTEEDWKPFRKGNRRDGKKFEDLVELLLPRLYPGLWTRTKQSWDRGRDFWGTLGGKRACAECKNYDARISLQVISPTLVMALIDDFDCILFFSASEIVTNAMRHLAHYQERTRKEIQVYHGPVLEKLLLEHRDLASRFFPSLKVQNPVHHLSLVIDHNISRDPDVEYLGDPLRNESPSQPRMTIQSLETFCLDIFLYNSDPFQSVEGLLDLTPLRSSTLFHLLNQSIRESGYRVRFSLAKARLLSLRLYLKALQPAAAAVLPDLTAETTSPHTTITTIKLPKVINISSILRTPLIGKKFIESTGRFDQLISHRDKPVVFVVHGPSGVGKSRLLRELRDSVFAHGYTLYSFRGENEHSASFDEFIRHYLAQRFRLPRRLPVEEERSKDVRARTNTKPALVGKALYDPDFQPSEAAGDCTDIFIRSLDDRHVALLVDDVQNFDGPTVDLLVRLTEAVHNTPGRLLILLAFNTDILPPDSRAAALLAHLREVHDDLAGQVMAVHVEGFSRSDTLTYLDHCLSVDTGTRPTIFSEAYPETANLFLRRIQHRALFLEQTLLHLESEGVIRREEDGLYIVEIDTFSQALDELPDSLIALYAKRWDFVRRVLGPSATSVLQVLTLLVYLPNHLAGRLELAEETIDKLMVLGVVRKNERGYLTFYHQTLFRFFKERLPFARGAIANRVLNFLSDKSLAGEYPLQRFLLAETLDELRPEDLAVAVNIIRTRFVQNPYLPEFLVSFKRSLTLLPASVPRTEVVEALDTVAYRLKSEVSFEASFNAYRELFEQRLREPEELKDAGVPYFRFLLRYAAVSLSVRRDDEALRILESAYPRVARFRFPSRIAEEEMRCLLGNRLCVALRSMSRRREALEIGRQSLRAAKRAGLRYIELQNRIDIGYIFYGERKDRRSLLKEWKKAVEMFRASDLPKVETITNRAVFRYHKVHVLALQRRFEEAVKVIDEEVPICASKLDVFHEVKLLLMKVVVGLLENPSREPSPDVLLATTQKAIDKCVRAGAWQSYWVALYAEAKIYERVGEIGAAKRSFLRAFEQLTRVVRTEAMEARYRPFFEDFSIFMRRDRGGMEHDDLVGLKTPEIRGLVKRILSLEERRFAAFLSTFRPSSTYFTNVSNLPCP